MLYFISICKNAPIFFVFRLHLSSYACCFLFNYASAISSDQTGLTISLFGSFAEQVVGRHIHQVIANNQQTEDLISDVDIAARKLHFTPPYIAMESKCSLCFHGTIAIIHRLKG